MGASFGHLAGLAAPALGLAREICDDPVGLCRDRAGAHPIRAGAVDRPGAAPGGPSSRLQAAGADLSKVTFWHFLTDRSWVRDSGPIFVINGAGGRAVLDWHFNAWAKYPDWTRDDRLPSEIATALSLPCHAPGSAAGGWFWKAAASTSTGRAAAHHGGVSAERGPGSATRHSTEQDCEQLFAEYLGVRKVLWLGRGIAGDDTHGHVDDLARFVGPRTVVAVGRRQPADENYEPLRRESRAPPGHDRPDRRAAGGRAAAHASARSSFDGQRLPASYANFYIANGVVLVPTFNDPADRVALGILAELFPRSRGGRHPRRRPGLGPGHAALHDAAGTGGS